MICRIWGAATWASAASPVTALPGATDAAVPEDDLALAVLLVSGVGAAVACWAAGARGHVAVALGCDLKLRCKLLTENKESCCDKHGAVMLIDFAEYTARCPYTGTRSCLLAGTT